MRIGLIMRFVCVLCLLGMSLPTMALARPAPGAAKKTEKVKKRIKKRRQRSTPARSRGPALRNGQRAPGKLEEQQRVDTTNPSKIPCEVRGNCCAKERQRYCPNTKPGCLVDLVFELNQANGRLMKPLPGQTKRGGKPIAIGPVTIGEECWKALVKRIPSEATVSIMALGDSYFSGEGVPDERGTEYTSPDKRSDTIHITPSTAGQHPATSAKPYYKWTDEYCHRSKWGAPTRAVRQLEPVFSGSHLKPKVNFEFASYACSGATTEKLYGAYNIPKWYERGKAPISYSRPSIDDNDDREPGQLSQAKAKLKSLCTDKHPNYPHCENADIVLISSGGNDVNFPIRLIECIAPLGSEHHGDCDRVGTVIAASVRRTNCINQVCSQGGGSCSKNSHCKRCGDGITQAMKDVISTARNYFKSDESTLGMKAHFMGCFAYIYSGKRLISSFVTWLTQYFSYMEEVISAAKEVTASLASGETPDLSEIELKKPEKFWSLGWPYIANCLWKKRHEKGVDFGPTMNAAIDGYHDLTDEADACVWQVLDEKYEKMITRVEHLSHSEQSGEETWVYLREYPDPTRDADGNYCHKHTGMSFWTDDEFTQLKKEIDPAGINSFGGGALVDLGIVSLKHVDRSEAEGISQDFIAPLNQSVKRAVRSAQRRRRPNASNPIRANWQHIDTIDEAFHEHGYCAGDQAWVADQATSWRDAGSLMGIIHPNKTGADKMGQLIKDKLVNRINQLAAKRAITPGRLGELRKLMANKLAADRLEIFRECRLDMDCQKTEGPSLQEHKICIDGQCVATECRTNNQCPGNRICLRGQCKLAPRVNRRR